VQKCNNLIWSNNLLWMTVRISKTNPVAASFMNHVRQKGLISIFQIKRVRLIQKQLILMFSVSARRSLSLTPFHRYRSHTFTSLSFWWPLEGRRRLMKTDTFTRLALTVFTSQWRAIANRRFINITNHRNDSIRFGHVTPQCRWTIRTFNFHHPLKIERHSCLLFATS
jgi:hypothetical protein